MNFSRRETVFVRNYKVNPQILNLFSLWGQMKELSDLWNQNPPVMCEVFEIVSTFEHENNVLFHIYWKSRHWTRSWKVNKRLNIESLTFYRLFNLIWWSLKMFAHAFIWSRCYFWQTSTRVTPFSFSQLRKFTGKYQITCILSLWMFISDFLQ